jgi:hypothetical protein
MHILNAKVLVSIKEVSANDLFWWVKIPTLPRQMTASLPMVMVGQGTLAQFFSDTQLTGTL